MNQEKIKRIIGSVCVYLIYSIVGLLVLCLFVVLIDVAGLLKTIISIIGGLLVVFIMWVAVNWGDL